MAPALEFTAIVTDGRLPESVARQIGAAIRGFNGKRVVLSVREQKRKRSNNQNAYYWGVVVQAVLLAFREHGNMVDAEDVHNFLAQHVGSLTQIIVTPDDRVAKTLGSTAKLNTAEFEAYLERIRVWAAETLGTAIPLPNEEEPQPSERTHP